ncbi:MAG: hypothetical protein EOO65_05145 [Methanosarcinales archaeon]|nr:MAG: hypothetical protein EOO65_05145 [Methanosarcinales archaeon]
MSELLKTLAAETSTSADARHAAHSQQRAPPPAPLITYETAHVEVHNLNINVGNNSSHVNISIGPSAHVSAAPPDTVHTRADAPATTSKTRTKTTAAARADADDTDDDAAASRGPSSSASHHTAPDHRVAARAQSGTHHSTANDGDRIPHDSTSKTAAVSADVEPDAGAGANHTAAAARPKKRTRLN